MIPSLGEAKVFKRKKKERVAVLGILLIQKQALVACVSCFLFVFVKYLYLQT
jgi:hypothetical protein